MPKITLPSISDVRADFPQFSFEEHDVFHWSPKKNCVYYNPTQLKKTDGAFQLFHEIGHALCQHQYYTSGIELLRIEVEAWEKAKEIAKNYGLKISQQRIETCLDSYRDWLYLRSTCPTCETVALETGPNRYHCFNCLQKWSVPTSQRSRHYRLKQVS